MKTLVGLRILMNMLAMVMVGLMIGLQHSYNLHLMKSLLLFSWSFMDLSITIVKLILAFGTEK